MESYIGELARKPLAIMPPARILIVEDDQEFGRLLQAVLVNHGYDVECSGTIPDCRARIAREAFDLVLADVRVPGGLGIELLFLEKEPDVRIPLILMTGFGNHELRAFVEGLGVDLLDKPFEMEELLDRIPRVLVKRQTRRASPQRRSA